MIQLEAKGTLPLVSDLKGSPLKRDISMDLSLRSHSITDCMVDERKDVEFPLWRKKVDGSTLEHGQTVIPDWVKDGVFGIREVFTESSKKKSESEVTVELNYNGKRTIYQGWVTTTKFGEKWAAKRKPVMRFFFDNELRAQLRRIFTMSYMRDLERRMRKAKVAEIEAEIPFYEFLDIEWDSASRKFIFKPHYVQAPVYEELFASFQSKRILERIENEIEGNTNGKISKGDWKLRSEMSKEVTTENVIYTLIDVNNAEIYVGEASNLSNRFKQKRHEIPDWTHYRVDQLPDDFDDKMRVTLERMMIRSLASLLENNAGIESMEISDFILTNKRIDK